MFLPNVSIGVRVKFIPQVNHLLSLCVYRCVKSVKCLSRSYAHVCTYFQFELKMKNSYVADESSLSSSSHRFGLRLSATKHTRLLNTWSTRSLFHVPTHTHTGWKQNWSVNNSRGHIWNRAYVTKCQVLIYQSRFYLIFFRRGFTHAHLFTFISLFYYD